MWSWKNTEEADSHLKATVLTESISVEYYAVALYYVNAYTYEKEERIKDFREREPKGATSPHSLSFYSSLFSYGYIKVTCIWNVTSETNVEICADLSVLCRFCK